MAEKPPSRFTLLDRLDRDAEAFSSSLSLEYYLNYSGQKDNLALSPIFERHATLFRRATVDALHAAEHTDPRYWALRQFVVEGYMEQAAKELTEELARRETADTVRWEERDVPYRALPSLIMNEADFERRHELDRLRMVATVEQNSLRERRWDVLYTQARELCYPTYAALCEDVGSLDLDKLQALMERFIWDTEKAYRALLEGYLASIEIAAALAERSDLSFLFRSPELDHYFSSERILPALTGTLEDLGIDVRVQANVHLDTEARPKKSPRAFCSAVRIPDEVYLVISPHGGHDDYRALLHEAGHAQHFAHVDLSLPFAHRGLGDNSVTEAFAFLMEHLTHSPHWLRRHLEVADGDDYRALIQFQKLYMLRRYGAKLQYELHLHRGNDVRSFAKHYSDLLTAAVGVRYAPEDYLFDLDDAFYCARYLNAWILESQIRRYLEQRWGPEWFCHSDAGRHLRELWAQGQRHTAEDLARQIGYEGLDTGPLAAEFKEQAETPQAPPGPLGRATIGRRPSGTTDVDAR
jgi:hypothetical protein